jgi:hypothetical protein
MWVTGYRVKLRGEVVVLRLLAVRLDQVLARTVDLAQCVLLDPGRVADSTAALIAAISRLLTR